MDMKKFELNLNENITNDASTYFCNICNKNFVARTSYRKHIRKFHNIEPPVDQFTCCNLVFSSVDTFEKHKSIHKRNIKCNICHRAFSHRNTLKRHQISAHEPNTKFYCDYCGKSFMGKNHVRRHLLRRVCRQMKRHPRKIYQNCAAQCEHCNKPFLNVLSLPKHYMLCRANLRRCATCDMVLGDMNVWQKHLEIHSDNKLYDCNLCGKLFLHIWEHTVHQNSHPDRKFICDVCNKSFKTNSHRKEHMKFHVEKTFECDLCKKMFCRKIDIRNHLHVAHSGVKPFMCHSCGAAFSRSTDLKRHMDCVHNTARPFKCNFCDKSFKRKSILKNHQNIHGDAKPFKCNMCDKSYTQAYSLKEHQILHTNPLRCTICNRSFTRMSRLAEHYKLNNCTPKLKGSHAVLI